MPAQTPLAEIASRQSAQQRLMMEIQLVSAFEQAED
jgi:hypothetical protein